MNQIGEPYQFLKKFRSQNYTLTSSGIYWPPKQPGLKYFPLACSEMKFNSVQEEFHFPSQRRFWIPKVRQQKIIVKFMPWTVTSSFRKKVLYNLQPSTYHPLLPEFRLVLEKKIRYWLWVDLPNPNPFFEYPKIHNLVQLFSLYTSICNKHLLWSKAQYFNGARATRTCSKRSGERWIWSWLQRGYLLIWGSPCRSRQGHRPAAILSWSQSCVFKHKLSGGSSVLQWSDSTSYLLPIR